MTTFVNQQVHTESVPPPDVLGVSEIADLLGLTRQRVLQLANDPTFPRPTILKGGKIWDRADVLEWARRTERKIHD